MESILRHSAQFKLNGAPHIETGQEQLARIERLLESIHTTLDTQSKRMANMQIEIDRLRKAHA